MTATSTEERVQQLARQRRQRIRSREAALKERSAKQQSGGQRNSFLPRDVIRLKEIFDLYDRNGDGVLDSSELRRALEVQKDKQQRAMHDSLHKGTKCTLEERQRAQGVVQGARLDQKANASNVFLVDMSSQLFSAMDLNGDGGVEFKELLRICYPTAAKFERDEMLSWLQNSEGAAPLASSASGRLSAKAAADIAALFRLYDTDRGGALTKAALQSAVRFCGLTAGEEEQLFAEYDSNGDDLIDLAEFTAMFASTGAFDRGEPTGV